MKGFLVLAIVAVLALVVPAQACNTVGGVAVQSFGFVPTVAVQSFVPQVAVQQFVPQQVQTFGAVQSLGVENSLCSTGFCNNGGVAVQSFGVQQAFAQPVIVQSAVPTVVVKQRGAVVRQRNVAVRSKSVTRSRGRGGSAVSVRVR